MRKEPQITSECPSLAFNLEICLNSLKFIVLREVLQKLKESRDQGNRFGRVLYENSL